jgi:hypothetical protein
MVRNRADEIGPLRIEEVLSPIPHVPLESIITQTPTTIEFDARAIIRWTDLW